jgi:Helicase associated domain
MWSDNDESAISREAHPPFSAASSIDCNVISKVDSAAAFNYSASLIHLYQQQVNDLSYLFQSHSTILNPYPIHAVTGRLSNLYELLTFHDDSRHHLRLHTDLHSGARSLNDILHRVYSTSDQQTLGNSTSSATIYHGDDGSSPSYLANVSVVDSNDPKLDCQKHRKSTASDDENVLTDAKSTGTRNRTKSIPRVKQHQHVASKWYTLYEQLLQFKQLYGHTIVPRGYSANVKLASWVCQSSHFTLT